MIKNLFYTEKDKQLFWIAGYADNTFNVKDIICQLQNQYNYFLKIGNNKTINTTVIKHSRRYKNMRVYWCDVHVAPKDAMVIGGSDWTMWEWLDD